MSGASRSKPGLYLLILLASLLVLGVACGTSDTPVPEATTAPEATPAPAATSPPAAATEAPASATTAPHATAASTTATPIAAPAATRLPRVTTGSGPTGTLNIGFKEIGPYTGHPSKTSWPQYGVVQLAAFEGLFGRDSEGTFWPKLVESWSVDDDQLTWTFKLEEGVQFHDDWGEMTADDAIWSVQEFAAEGSFSGGVAQIRRLWLNPEGHVRALDKYTIEVNTGVPGWDMLTWINSPAASGTWVISKKQVEELGPDEANVRAAGTGPWRMVDNVTDDFWHFEGLADHWRKPPEFSELYFRVIPEEATRIANFQTGNIDIFAASPDSIPTLAEIPETRFMSQAGSSESHLGIYGMWHEYVGTDKEREGWDPEAPYISPTADTTTEEWERARKVREAMGIAIDREKLVRELLRDEGAPLSMWGWASFDHRADPDWVWDYDPERAKQLLAEAGYPDGFDVEITPSIRGAPAEVEACEAVADMWQDVGINARLQRIPFNTLVEGQFARTNTGITCHAAQPLVEPLVLYGFMYDPIGSWSAGNDHPYLTERLHQASVTFDTDERWALQLEMAHWIWDNSFDIGLYSVNNIYPLGPKIDSWEDHLETGDPRRLSALEFAPRRK